MKFTIEREILLSAIQNVSKGLSQKTPMPILTGIHIILEEEKLILVTTNKEIAVKVEIEKNDKLKIFETGDCVVPGKYFGDIIRKVEGKDVAFTLYDDKTVQILSDRSDFTLIVYDKTNYPRTNFEVDNEAILFDSNELKKIIRQTTFACSTSENRIVLTSLNFKAKNGQLEITATDSFRLAKKISKLDENVNVLVNVPSKALEEFYKIIEDDSTFIKLYLENSKATFVYKNIVFVTRLVEGNYPDTSSLFPKEFLFFVEFNRMELLNAVDRASLFTSLDNLSIVKLNFSSADKVEISSNSSEIGKVVEDVSLVSDLKDVNFQIAFSTKHLIEALKSFDSETVTFYFTGEIKPTLIKDKEKGNLTQLLLPVRVF